MKALSGEQSAGVSSGQRVWKGRAHDPEEPPRAGGAAVVGVSSATGGL